MRLDASIACTLLSAPIATAQIVLPAGPSAPASSHPLLQVLPVSVWGSPQALGDRVAFFVYENGAGAGQDLNNDGDLNDRVLGTYDRSTSSLVMTDLDGRFFRMSDGFIAVHREESDSGLDHNGDGDALDEVLFIYDLVTQTSRSLPGTVLWMMDVSGDLLAYEAGLPELGLRVYSHTTQTVFVAGFRATDALCGDTGVAYVAVEYSIPADLNGDGDTEDFVLRHLSADFATTTDSGTPAFNLHGFSGNSFVFSGRETSNGDVNLDGDTADTGVYEMNVQSGVTRTLGVVEGEISPRIDVEAGRAFFRQDETFAGDQNADGDNLDHILVAHSLGTTQFQSMGLDAFFDGFSNGRVLARVSEAGTGADLSGDGDLSDHVAHRWTLAGGQVTNLGLPVYQSAGAQIGPTHAVLLVSELDLMVDLNGDGDVFDEYPVVIHVATGQSHWIPLAGGSLDFDEALENGFTFRAFESESGDLNLDGDTNDSVLQVYEFKGNRLLNTRFATYAHTVVAGSRFVVRINEGNNDQDYNQDGDLSDSALVLGRLR